MTDEAVIYAVDETLMNRIYFAIEASRENAIECFNYNEQSNNSSKARIAKLIQADINEAESIIKILSEKWSFGR